MILTPSRAEAVENAGRSPRFAARLTVVAALFVFGTSASASDGEIILPTRVVDSAGQPVAGENFSRGPLDDTHGFRPDARCKVDCGGAQMTRLVVRSRVDPDGVLRVAVPIGREEADRELQVTIEPVPAASEGQSEYVAWLRSVAGRWQGDFERLPQGPFEVREAL